jgi:hypothetical protein
MKLRPTVASLLIGVLAAGIVGFFIQPAVVIQNESKTIAIFWRYQDGSLRFINSVTGKPVLIRFRIQKAFSDFRMETDELTEQYYTAGTYTINGPLHRESTKELHCCSMKGMILSIGDRTWLIDDGCLEVRLIWTL